jgi:phenylalanyl-tRNA synthetase beta chain
MKWLGEYYQPKTGIRQFCADMTMSGSKAEGYETEGEGLKNIVVGHVLSVEKHPDADTLWICQLEVGGGERVQIVTGADNVTPGAYVPVAMHKSVVAGGKQITRGKLRGQTSDGMLCSLGELGLSKGDFPYAREDGIFLLGEDCDRTPGLPVQQAIGLDDTTVEFEITPNRPDCLSVIGLAREAAVTYGDRVTLREPAVKAGGADIGSIVTVDVENPQLCLRYAAAAVTGVRVGPSPRWMRERLRASGVRPINNIVDITNYVMLEYGQPMHAFDLRHVKGAHIIVRNARDGESITTLDGVVRALSPEMLAICDEEAPSAVAGVMGGEFSGVYGDSDTVIFESACFNGPSVRITAKKLGMRTESSGRFEKQLDPGNCLPALKRACELVELLGAGTVASGFLDIDNSDKKPPSIPLSAARINAFLGVDLPEPQMISILERLDCRVENGLVTPPSYRGDIKAECDLAEEIARIYGYNNIPVTSPRGAAKGIVTPAQKAERSIHGILAAQGFSEIYTYSFISPKAYDRILLPADSPLRNSVIIANPLGEDTGVMRTTAVPSMMDILAYNYNNRNPEASLYEMSTEYLPKAEGELPDEIPVVMLGQYGKGASFYTMKGALESLFAGMKVAEWELAPNAGNPTFHPGRCADILIGGKACGMIGEVHPAVLEQYGVGTRCYIARVEFAAILQYRGGEEASFKPLPRFPASTRDLALVCAEETQAGDIEKRIRKAIGGMLEQLELFDVYRGGQVGAGKKSVAYSLLLRAADRTLTDEECDRAVGKALSSLAEIGVGLRS